LKFKIQNSYPKIVWIFLIIQSGISELIFGAGTNRENQSGIWVAQKHFLGYLQSRILNYFRFFLLFLKLFLLKIIQIILHSSILLPFQFHPPNSFRPLWASPPQHPWPNNGQSAFFDRIFPFRIWLVSILGTFRHSRIPH